MRVRGPPLLDLIVPVRCAACANGESPLCVGCRSSLERLAPPVCDRCGAPTRWPVARCRECQGRRLAFRTARAAVTYDDAARRLVAAWKERGLRRLDRLLAELVVETVARPDADVITHIPADRDRLLWRGSNAAQSLAEALAQQWELPTLRLVERTRRVERQRGLSRQERRANVRGAFSVGARPPRRVVLVDDVYTTGATVGVVATELRRAGARTVDVVTFARAVRR